DLPVLRAPLAAPGCAVFPLRLRGRRPGDDGVHPTAEGVHRKGLEPLQYVADGIIGTHGHPTLGPDRTVVRAAAEREEREPRLRLTVDQRPDQGRTAAILREEGIMDPDE